MTGGFQTGNPGDGPQWSAAGWRPRAHKAALAAMAAAAAILLAGALIPLAWLGDLPDPVAIHWGAGGQPDGFGSFAASSFAVTLGVGLPTSLLLAAIVWFAGNAATTRRLMSGFTVGLAAFMAGINCGLLWAQRGLADASQATDANSGLMLGLVLGLAAGVIAGLATPGDPPLPATEPVPEDAAKVPLADSERAVWIARVDLGRRYMAFMIAITVSLAIATVWLTVYARTWFMIAIMALTTAALFAFTSATVRVDETGFTLRGPLGWPHVFIPADEVIEATVETISPFRDFGGWGYRVSVKDGKSGWVTATGPALVIKRTGERTFVLSTPDAEAAAALLNTYAARAR
jgi:hypothetical protein